MLSPYLRASEGTPLGIGEREKLPTSAQMFMKLVVIIHWSGTGAHPSRRSGVRGGRKIADGPHALVLQTRRSLVENSEAVRLAIFSNLFEAMYARLADGDPTWMQRFGRSLRDTVLISPEMQVWDALTTIKAWGYRPDRQHHRPDAVRQEQGWNRRSAASARPAARITVGRLHVELSRLMAATFGISAYKTDNVVRSMLANVGKDFLTVTDLICRRSIAPPAACSWRVA